MWLSNGLDCHSRQRSFIAAPMAKKSADKILSGSQLVIATAEKVFGWKNIYKHNGELVGKKQDKPGRWR